MKAKLLRRNAYGWDQSGEVIDNQQKNVEDTATPVSQHQTPPNIANILHDTEAEEEFPGLGEHMHRYPSRGLN